MQPLVCVYVAVCVFACTCSYPEVQSIQKKIFGTRLLKERFKKIRSV